MNDSWNLTELREHIRRLGDDNRHLSETVDSIDRSVTIFRYHLVMARDALKGIIDNRNLSNNLELVLGVSGKQRNYKYAMLVSEAHIISCILTTRSIYDIFAQLLNGLLLERKIPVHLCDITKVRKHLPQSRLKEELGELLLSDWFEYIVAFTNTAKHRNLIGHNLTVSSEENIAGVRIEQFPYNGKTYPAYWANEVLEGGCGG